MLLCCLFCFMTCNLKIFLSGSLLVWFVFLSLRCFFLDRCTGILRVLKDSFNIRKVAFCLTSYSLVFLYLVFLLLLCLSQGRCKK